MGLSEPLERGVVEATQRLWELTTRLVGEPAAP